MLAMAETDLASILDLHMVLLEHFLYLTGSKKSDHLLDEEVLVFAPQKLVIPLGQIWVKQSARELIYAETEYIGEEAQWPMLFEEA